MAESLQLKKKEEDAQVGTDEPQAAASWPMLSAAAGVSAAALQRRLARRRAQRSSGTPVADGNSGDAVGSESMERAGDSAPGDAGQEGRGFHEVEPTPGEDHPSRREATPPSGKESPPCPPSGVEFLSPEQRKIAEEYNRKHVSSVVQFDYATDHAYAQKINGVYTGRLDVDRVADWQCEHGLQADGCVGDETVAVATHRKPCPDPPQPPTPTHDVHGIEGLRYGDGTAGDPDAKQHKPHVRKLQQLLNEHSDDSDDQEALLDLNGEFDEGTRDALKAFQKAKFGNTKNSNEVDPQTAESLRSAHKQKASELHFDPKLEGYINAIWLQLQLSLHHGINAIEALRNDLKVPPKFVFWKAAAKAALRLPIAVLLGDGFPDMIGKALGKVFEWSDEPERKNYVNFVIKPPFDALKDTVGDTIQSFIDSKADSKNAEQQLDDFTTVQRETLVDSSGKAQEEFLLESAPKIRDSQGDRVKKAEDHLCAEKEVDHKFFEKQYATSMSAWATMLAHKELNKEPPPVHEPDPTKFKGDPNKDRKVDGVMDACFNGVHDQPDMAVVLTARPTLRGIPESAATHFKDRTFSELNMPMVARVHISRVDAPTYDLFIESTEKAQSKDEKAPKHERLDYVLLHADRVEEHVDDGQVKERRDFTWKPEQDKDRELAVAYLSRKDSGKDTKPNEASAAFGARKLVLDEIANIKIDDLEIKS